MHKPSDFAYRQDNPGEDYCLRKQRLAVEQAKGEIYGMAAYMTAGPVTAHMGIFKPMYLPANLIRHLPGVNNEQYHRRPGDAKFDSLQSRVKDNGWNQEHAIMVRVNHLGLPYIMEGNTRATIGHLHGVKDVKVQFEWVNGAENAEDDTWSPARVAALGLTEPRDFQPQNFWENALRVWVNIIESLSR